MKNLIYRGSVKDIYDYGNETLCFKFSNRYSLFDWGEMPNSIPNKGEYLARFTKGLFKQLASPLYWQKNLKRNDGVAQDLKMNGLKTHLCNIDSAKDEMIVKRVEDFGRDFSCYHQKPKNAFIPLEVIFRNGVPQGSSLLSRKENTFVTGQLFETPMVECSTKWERIDRMLDWNEAQSLAALNQAEKDKFIALNECLALSLKEYFGSVGITLWDGKTEWAFTSGENDTRDFMLVDSIGPDELRLSHEDFLLSKEFLRSWYRETNWFEELKNAKQKHASDFKAHCSTPPLLPKQIIEVTSKIYETLALLVEGNNQLPALVKCLKEL